VLDQAEMEDHGSTYEEDREDELGIGENAVYLDDDVDENMLENDIDDDDDIVNPLNILFELNDDTDVEFDEEEELE
jgi:hypothetical protein